MQTILREAKDSGMKESEAKIFIDAHSSSKLVSRDQAGHVIASLAIAGSKDLSGRYISWDQDECADHRKA